MKNIFLKLGIGADIEEIKRFNTSERKDPRFLNKVFSKKEQKYCLQKKKPDQHLASCYCGKEAVVKAFGDLGINNIDYKDIEINHKKNGAPYINLSAHFSSQWQTKISLSHCEDKAIAFAIIVPKNKKSHRKVFKYSA